MLLPFPLPGFVFCIGWTGEEGSNTKKGRGRRNDDDDQAAVTQSNFGNQKERGAFSSSFFFLRRASFHALVIPSKKFPRPD